MPKQVNPATRRLDVVDALFRIVVRDGLQHASLRAVADEAQLNTGSLRHYFESQQELMRFAMQSMLDRVATRMLRRLDEVGDVDALPLSEQRKLRASVLEELLPLDDVRRTEVIVFVEFIMAARTNPLLSELARTSALGTRSLVRRALTRMAGRGNLRTGIEIEAEITRLVALLDGLCLNAVLYPDVLSAQDCVAALRFHLADLEAH
ncbi:MAG TPA: TetR/AcrR family transcriptional regulator [Mycobacteriales bacterium]|nr:TetR/AcrR family transcriptional regulator [Mycobacteriales bacterium]